mmetsp:Transcript_10333/g.29010  ORF Transcript_10333/g.29010 Transcript_10333/m.29010 type:complete len:311 (-) Transcript_10333:489-1421(-)
MNLMKPLVFRMWLATPSLAWGLARRTPGWPASGGCVAGRNRFRKLLSTCSGSTRGLSRFSTLLRDLRDSKCVCTLPQSSSEPVPLRTRACRGAPPLVLLFGGGTSTSTRCPSCCASSISFLHCLFPPAHCLSSTMKRGSSSTSKKPSDVTRSCSCCRAASCHMLCRGWGLGASAPAPEVPAGVSTSVAKYLLKINFPTQSFATRITPASCSALRGTSIQGTEICSISSGPGMPASPRDRMISRMALFKGYSAGSILGMMPGGTGAALSVPPPASSDSRGDMHFTTRPRDRTCLKMNFCFRKRSRNRVHRR